MRLSRYGMGVLSPDTNTSAAYPPWHGGVPLDVAIANNPQWSARGIELAREEYAQYAALKNQAIPFVSAGAPKSKVLTFDTPPYVPERDVPVEYPVETYREPDVEISTPSPREFIPPNVGEPLKTPRNDKEYFEATGKIAGGGDPNDYQRDNRGRLVFNEYGALIPSKVFTVPTIDDMATDMRARSYFESIPTPVKIGGLALLAFALLRR